MAQAPWFYAPPELWSADSVTLPPDESHHATKVMRVAPPDVITVTNGRGLVARCAVTSTQGPSLAADVLEREERRALRPQIAVYQGAAKGQKTDYVVETLAELGAAETWVFESERAVAKWDKAKQDRLADRWANLARSAAKQSRNPYSMKTGSAVSWVELVRRIAKEPLAIVLWEEASLPLRTALTGASDRLALVVGPEGGLTRSEAEALADAGAQLVSLGPRILRTENAAPVTVSALLYHYGLIG
ncbi:MAG: rRNA (uracil1498-N3)-methyltransferase [Actinomycetota bacterium]|jgi:16S rRNA (uracil1498-N3)-methyltransferase|nr:rRNA (uracil1498-N3)-methyltransferase [Actinomycetota bacterium]